MSQRARLQLNANARFIFSSRQFDTILKALCPVDASCEKAHATIAAARARATPRFSSDSGRIGDNRRRARARDSMRIPAESSPSAAYQPFSHLATQRPPLGRQSLQSSQRAGRRKRATAVDNRQKTKQKKTCAPPTRRHLYRASARADDNAEKQNGAQRMTKRLKTLAWQVAASVGARRR